MGVFLGLCSAIFYGAGDFVAGLGGRRATAQTIAILSQPVGLVAAVVGVLLFARHEPSAGALVWGAVSGLGSGVGTIALYRGLTVGRMSVVAPLSAVLSAAIPAVVGLATGDSLALLGYVGLVLAIPAIALVSWEKRAVDASRQSGVVEGVMAGIGFAVLFIGLARAGTRSGAWPLVPGQTVAILVILYLGWASARTSNVWRAAWKAALSSGVLSGIANLFYLAATGQGQLAVVAVVTALYPAVTILLARGFLNERWAPVQAVGLVLSGAAVAMISLS